MEDEANYARVLIIGEIFRNDGGGGITLSNLFRNWPAEKLAVIADGVEKASGEVCYNYYQIGKDEVRILFPFSLVVKYNNSGPCEIRENKIPNTRIKGKNNHSALKKNLKRAYHILLDFIGVSHAIYKPKYSPRLKKWIEEFSPDIIYCQIFSLFTMQLVDQVQYYTKKPLVIHIMDDFVNIIVKPGLLKFYWRAMLNMKFQKIINTSTLCLSISQAMSLEFQRRYNKSFQDFRNPVDIDLWLPFSKSNWEFGKKFKILHAGRLVSPVSLALFDICQEVNNYNKLGVLFELDIVTFDRNTEFEKEVKDLSGINIKKPVPHEDIPQLVTEYDLLVLPIDFDRKGIRYAKYSISTKTSEFLISGVPILVYAPVEVAIYKYFHNNSLGFTVGKRSDLRAGLLEARENLEDRERYGLRGIKHAKENEDCDVVREKFRSLLAVSANIADIKN